MSRVSQNSNPYSATTLRLVLFSKFPKPGSVKTRLAPALGEDGAATLHRRLAKHCFDVMSAAAQTANAICEVRYSGADEAAFRNWLGNDALYVQQSDGDLGMRLEAAVQPPPCIFFGADTPDLTEAIVAQAIAALDQTDVVIGPAQDGGYYLIGVRGGLSYLFENMPWSTAHLLAETKTRLRQNGIEPYMLETLRDCDRPEDLAAWPWLFE